jgi:hypothetical protein
MKKRHLVSCIGVVVVLAVPAIGADEITLEQAVKAWSFLEGDWITTEPAGTTLETKARLARSKTAYILESGNASHVFGWDPESKRLEVQSFLGDGSRGVAFFVRTSDNQLRISESKLVAPDGSEQPRAGEATFTVVDKDTYHFTIGEARWVARRKGK